MVELDDLYIERGKINVKILESERAKQKEDGLVVDSLEELTDDEVKSRKIPGSNLSAHVHNIEKGFLEIYAEADSPWMILGYDCPQCDGIVKGEPSKQKYDELAPLAGSAGTDYYCYLCDYHLGRAEIMRS